MADTIHMQCWMFFLCKGIYTRAENVIVEAYRHCLAGITRFEYPAKFKKCEVGLDVKRCSSRRQKFEIGIELSGICNRLKIKDGVNSCNIFVKFVKDSKIFVRAKDWTILAFQYL